MPVRNAHRVGDYLMVDSESGFVHYRSEMVQIWDGTWRHRDNFETRQPQEFIRAKNDPKALKNVQPEPAFAEPSLITPLTVGQTSALTNKSFAGAGTIFTFGVLGGDPGIGSMVIEGSAESGPFTIR